MPLRCTRSIMQYWERMEAEHADEFAEAKASGAALFTNVW